MIPRLTSERKLIGVEMEAHAVNRAVHDTLKPHPEFLCVKSICDFAEASKGDDWQEYAAFTAARFFRTFIEEEWDGLALPEPSPAGRSDCRDLGQFPQFMDDIIQTIDHATGTIRIATDYAGYGAFSAPDKFREYVSALERARARGCTIDVIVAGEHALEAHRRAGSRNSDAYEAGKTDGEFPALLDGLARRLDEAGVMRPSGNPRGWSFAEFLGALESLERHSAGELRKPANHLMQARATLPMYLWITESRAVWAIPLFDPTERLTAARFSGTMHRETHELKFADHGFLSTNRDGLGHRLGHVWDHYARDLSRVGTDDV